MLQNANNLWRRLHILTPTFFVALVATLLFSASAGRAGSAIPEIAVEPISGPPGTIVEISGSGFMNQTAVSIFFFQEGEKQPVGTPLIDPETGTFMTTVTVPGDAVPGLAIFFAGLAELAEADFFVDESEPIGDGTGPPPDKVAVCEVVLILERVRNRTGTSGTGEDTLEIKTTFPATEKTIQVTVPRSVAPEEDEGWITVATVAGRYTRPKKQFPREIVVIAGVTRLNDANLSFTNRPQGRNVTFRDVRCPDSMLIKFTEDLSIPLKSRANLFGEIDLEYRVIVREVMAQ